MARGYSRSGGYGGYGGYGGFGAYVSVGAKQSRATKAIAALKKKGITASPVVIEGKAITQTFWGKAWCENLERYSDFENRLPRGRSYVRNGFVFDLQIERGSVKARVQGSEAYDVEITVDAVAPKVWSSVVADCSGKVSSVLELLSGKLSSAVMDVVTRPGTGLFPTPKQIHLDCSCPDGAGMCKHIAATLYGIGARFDKRPELLFTLRHVDAADLVSAGATTLMDNAKASGSARAVTGDLSALFGLDLGPMDVTTTTAKKKAPAKKTAQKKTTAAKKTPAKKAAKKKTTKKKTPA